MAEVKRYSDIDHKFRKLSTGDINKVYDEKAINQSLTSLFHTIPGERFFNLTYGSNLPFLLFEPFDALTAKTITEEIQDSIRIWESARIRIKDLEVQLDYQNTRYLIRLVYEIKNTTETGNLDLLLKKL